MISEAQKRASAKWDSENTEKITIKLTKARDPSKEEIKAAAQAAGMSTNAFIIDAIRGRL